MGRATARCPKKSATRRPKPTTRKVTFESESESEEYLTTDLNSLEEIESSLEGEEYSSTTEVDDLVECF